MATKIGQTASELRTVSHSFFCFGFLSGDRKKMKIPAGGFCASACPSTLPSWTSQATRGRFRQALRQAQGPQRGSRLLSLSKQGSAPAYSLRYSLFGQAKRQADYRTSCSVFSSKTLRTRRSLEGVRDRTFSHSFFCFGFLSGDRKKMKNTDVQKKQNIIWFFIHLFVSLQI